MGHLIKKDNTGVNTGINPFYEVTQMSQTGVCWNCTSCD